jgi:hypothetical protein
MLLVYVDDAIICGPSSKVIDEIIASLKEGFDVTDKGRIDDYMGVLMCRLQPKTPLSSGNPI